MEHRDTILVCVGADHEALFDPILLRVFDHHHAICLFVPLLARVPRWLKQRTYRLVQGLTTAIMHLTPVRRPP
jgi:hypothetical protein